MQRLLHAVKGDIRKYSEKYSVAPSRMFLMKRLNAPGWSAWALIQIAAECVKDFIKPGN
jgi:hypothetical protein